MADIRVREGRRGRTYQVRYADPAAQSGYNYATFPTRKEALAFRDNSGARRRPSSRQTGIRQVSDAVEKWLEICEQEGTDGNEPVTAYTLKTYEYFADFMKAYPWPKSFPDLLPPDIVEFRSWLLKNAPSRYVARRTLSYFSNVVAEMSLRAAIASNVAKGITISSTSRYDQPVAPPTVAEFKALLAAVDRLANSRNEQIANAWRRNRPMIYLAGDTGMRPGEYLALPRFNVSKHEVKVDRALERTGDKISVTKTPAGWRTIDLSPATADMVTHYMENHAPDSAYDLVFPTKSGGWQSITNWRKLGFAAAYFEAGLVVQEEDANGDIVDKPKYAPYDLRHFYASMLIEKRVNLKRIQKLMGHTNIATTLNIYGHLIEKAEAQNEDRIGLISELH
jgi:integrase